MAVGDSLERMLPRAGRSSRGCCGDWLLDPDRIPVVVWGVQQLALAAAVLLTPISGAAQTVSLFPKQVPNGIAAGSGKKYHQRMDIQLVGSPVSQSVAFTIILPPELTFVTNSVSSTISANSTRANFVSASGQDLVFGLGGSTANLNGAVVTVELDVTTPSSFSGISEGGKQDTVYVIDFSPATNQTDVNAAVSKHQNRRVQSISFSAPDSTNGDTN